MRPRPYIGVSGFMHEDDVREVLESWPERTRHQLMVGVLVSKKTMRGERNKHPGRYPPPERIPEIFIEDERVLNLVHYHTDSRGVELVHEIVDVMEAAGPNCHGLQLNIRWPAVADLMDAVVAADRQGFPVRRLVLQCGRHAIEEASNDARELAKRLMEYEGVITDVLIDPSGGQGRAFDQQFAIECLTEIGILLPDIGFGVAGGLSAHTVGEALSGLLLAAEFAINTDAEGRLRDERDNLDVDAAILYARETAALIAGYDIVRA